MNDDKEAVLMHYGTPRHSGRYPWGSGEDPYQHESWFSHERKRLKEEFTSQGMSSNEAETAIAKAFNMTTKEYRERVNQNNIFLKEQDKRVIMNMKADGYSNVAIGKVINHPESYVRDVLKDIDSKKVNATTELANRLSEEVDKNGITDISKGIEIGLGVTANRLNNAAALLGSKGYEVFTIKVEQATNRDQKTSIKVIAPAGTTKAEAYNQVTKQGKLNQMNVKYVDGGATPTATQYPSSISPSRVYIRYAEDGGKNKDGVIELRRGVKDLSLGKSSYAQVRIAVNNTHYMKGMAMYSDDIPDGYDVVFNTNKKTGTPIIDTESEKNDKCVLKPLKRTKDGEIDEDMPFGALIKGEKVQSDGTIKAGGQSYYPDKNGLYVKIDGAYVKDDGTHKSEDHYNLSAINKLKEEGDWDSYSRSLSSQMLSKQNIDLIVKQLDLSYNMRAEEYEKIKKLNNTVVKKNQLQAFAEDCDSASVDLKAVALPGQESRVLLPVPDMADDEIYAPQYKNGSTVVLIRYPHGGIFEIPKLKVNNNQPTASKTIGPSAVDAVGISIATAEKLSGADFDGDTAIVIPVNSKVRINTMNSLQELKDWDISKYTLPDDAPAVSDKTGFHKQNEMGKVSNLITDMTIEGADWSEIARAVKHSMVVIDAEKHHYDWKASERDNGIKELKARYQGGPNKGAATIVSKASSEIYVKQRKTVPYTTYSSYSGGIDPETGEKIYVETGYQRPVTTGKGRDKVYVKNPDGTQKMTDKQQKVARMTLYKDARALISDYNTEQEQAYANYANKLKALANEARLEYLHTENYKVNPEAKVAYADQVESLKAQLTRSEENAPRERMAQVSARAVINAKIEDNPDLKYDKDALKKESQNALSDARIRYGAHRYEVNFSPKEWEAVQAGAISPTMLEKLLTRANSEAVAKLATPSSDKNSLSDAQLAVLLSMRNSGYSISEIAQRLGCSTSTVSSHIKD